MEADIGSVIAAYYVEAPHQVLKNVFHFDFEDLRSRTRFDQIITKKSYIEGVL